MALSKSRVCGSLYFTVLILVPSTDSIRNIKRGRKIPKEGNHTKMKMVTAVELFPVFMWTANENVLMSQCN